MLRCGPERPMNDDEPENDDLPKGDEADDEEEGEAGPYLVRLVRESELRETGRATPTGIHLALWGPDVADMDAWELGEVWGYSPPEIEEIRLAGDHFLAVLQEPSERFGRASADALAHLVVQLRPDVAEGESEETIARALVSTPREAEERRLRKIQRRVADVFGIRDGVFGDGRIARKGEEAYGPTFVLDEKLFVDGVNGLLPNSSARLEDYPELASVVRLPWDDEGEE